jgi:tRNA nucleotidyltransferase (CCA-adding enzyme)
MRNLLINLNVMIFVRDVVAKDIMSYPIVAVGVNASVEEAARVMVSKAVGSVLVSDGKDYVGIITKMDVVRLVARGKDPSAAKAKSAMSSPLKKVDVSAKVLEIARVMSRENIHRVVVVGDRGVVGVISDKDIVDVTPGIIELIVEHGKIEGR